MDATRILVCEDETLIALDLKIRLERLGHVVVGVASSARQAIEIAEKTKPEMALMDVHLEGSVPGTEVAKVLAKEYGVPSIFVTAYSDSETLDEAKEAMPLGFLVKPIGDNELRSAIEIGKSLFDQHKRMEREARERLEKLQSAFLQQGQDPEWFEHLQSSFQSEKERLMTNIAAGVAHHLNNALAGIAGSLEWLTRCGTIPPYESRYVQSALTGCYNAAALVNDLLWASGQGLFMRQFCHLEEVLDTVVEKMRADDPASCKIITRYDGHLPRVVAHSEALAHALKAVIANACEVTPKGAEVIISVFREHFKDPRDKNIHSKPGWFACVKIRDLGPGMDEEVLEHATEPFFSGGLNEMHHGMGLAVARGVALSLGGWLDIESERERGTVVKFYLPLCDQQSSESKASKPKLKVRVGGLSEEQAPLP